MVKPLKIDGSQKKKFNVLQYGLDCYLTLVLTIRRSFLLKQKTPRSSSRTDTLTARSTPSPSPKSTK